MQRFFDIFFSVFALALLFPVIFFVSLILFFSGEGEIFYLQERVGLGGRIFKVFKFATMRKNSSVTGSGQITIRNDPRVLPIGKILRKTKINELPQLVNVLRGDMSLVGPRPLTKKNFNYYTKTDQSEIQSVKPGLSGIGSIIFRNEEDFLVNQKNATKFYRLNIVPYKAEIEKWYIKNKSFKIYIYIIIITIWIIIFPKSKIIANFFPDIPNSRKFLHLKT